MENGRQIRLYKEQMNYYLRIHLVKSPYKGLGKGSQVGDFGHSPGFVAIGGKLVFVWNRLRTLSFVGARQDGGAGFQISAIQLLCKVKYIGMHMFI